MTLVNITLDKNLKVKKVTVGGHTGYDDLGKDIVCSAVSTAMYVSIGLVEKTCLDYDFKSNDKNATMELVINKSNEFTDMILDNLVSTLEGISESYPKNLKIKINK